MGTHRCNQPHGGIMLSLKQSRSFFISTLIIASLLLSIGPPAQVTARPSAAPAVAVPAVAAPDAALDVPTTIVNEPATEWLIYKGVIYWSNHCFPITLQAKGPSADTTLKRMPTGGGAVTTLGTDANNCLNFANLAVDDSGVYFSNGVGKIQVIRMQGPTPVLTDVTPASNVAQIKLDANFVYYFTGSSGIFRVPKTGGPSQTLHTTAFGMRDMIFNETSVYWFDSSGLWWGPKTCATLPCSKTPLSAGTIGNHMKFGSIGEAGSSPGSIIFVKTSGALNAFNSIQEYTCSAQGICQVSVIYSAAQGWAIGRLHFVQKPSPGPLPTFERLMFWPERDGSTGRLLRRDEHATGATPSEIYPGDSTLSQITEIDAKGIYFSDASKIMFLPFTASAITRDLALAGMEVTQAIQNLANQVNLVADKSTYVRVYGKQNSGPQAGSVEMALHGTRNGAPLPGSPLQPVFGNVSLNTSFVFDRAKSSDGWLFRLPTSWISRGTIALRAEIDPRARYEDPNAFNDTLSFNNTTFVREPNACLFFSPVRTDNPLPHVGDPKFWDTMERFARVWPVPSVEVHSLGEPIEELEVCTWHGIPYPCFGPYELDQGLGVTNFPSDKDRVIGKLMLRQAIARASTAPPLNYCQAGAAVHAVGLVHPEADTTDSDGTLLGYANYYVNASFYKMEPFNSQPSNPPWYWPRAASVLAQEVTHNYNRRHVACGTNDAVDNGFPYTNKCQLNDGGPTTFFGFDVKSRLPIPPQIASDFMSYTPRRADAPLWQGQWVSDYTYSALQGKFGLQATTNLPGNEDLAGLSSPALPEAGEMVYAIGAIEPISNIGHLDYSYAQPLAALSAQARGVWQEFSAAPWQAGTKIKAATAITYHLRLKDASGNVLDDRTITPFEGDAHAGDRPAWPFLVTFPAPSGIVTRMELMADNAILDTLNVGPNAPVVSIASPKPGDNVSDTLMIQWQGSDPDAQDVLHYNVQYSPNNGTTWLSLVEDLPTTPGVDIQSLTVRNVLALPGTLGATARILVTASDGYHTTGALSGPFSVAQRAPEAHITSPNAALSYEPNAEVALQGGAIDAESGTLTGTALSWAVNGVPNGSGEENSVRGLKPGAHTVTLSATDNTSRTATAQTALHINPVVLPVANSVPVLDGVCDDGAYDSGELQLSPYVDGTQATARLLMRSDKLWVCFTGLARGSNAVTGWAGLFADVDSSQDATGQASDVGFFVAEDGVAFALLGNGNPGNPAALDARVTATGTVWMAELQVDVASLGGVGHAIGLRLSHNAVDSAVDAFAWPYRSQQNVPNSWGQTVLGTWPTLDDIAPISTTVGSGDVFLTLTGTNFVSGTQVLLDGAALTTTPAIISSTLMGALIPAAKLNAAGLAKVQVAGPGLLNAPSPAAGLGFQIVGLTPVITALTPDTAGQGAEALMTVTGSGFLAGATVLWNGQALPTTVLNGTQVQAKIGVAQLQPGRVAQVAVQNDLSSGNPSNVLPFLVSALRAVYVPIAKR